MESTTNRARISQRYIILIVMIIAIGSLGVFYVSNYSGKVNESLSSQTSTGVVEDSDGNIYNFKIMSDERVWMTENLSVDISESYCQQDDELQCNWYGRLYTWEAAMRGCGKLGDRWRLPTNEEWRTLAKSYGGVVDDSNDKGKAAYVSLLAGGYTEFNALLGGNREVNGYYERLEAHGFYWTATEHDREEAWFYNFAKGSTLLNHHTGSRERALSVRCIKEMEEF